MFAYSHSSCCQQLGLREPPLRGTATCKYQFLQHILELKWFVPVATRLSQNDKQGQDACFVRSHCTHRQPRGPVERRPGDPAIGDDQLVQRQSRLKRFSRYTGGSISRPHPHSSSQGPALSPRYEQGLSDQLFFPFPWHLCQRPLHGPLPRLVKTCDFKQSAQPASQHLVHVKQSRHRPGALAMW